MSFVFHFLQVLLYFGDSVRFVIAAFSVNLYQQSANLKTHGIGSSMSTESRLTRYPPTPQNQCSEYMEVTLDFGLYVTNMTSSIFVGEL